MTTVFVDAENVRRSRWPNLSPAELVERCRAWSREQGVRAVVVFDGDAPAAADDEVCEVVCTGSESADDWIARAVRDADAYWLATSDRELRERAGAQAERIIGGGAFLAQL